MNGLSGRPASDAAPGRQPARIVEGQPEGGYTDAFGIICCDCGDHPDQDYREVSPKLQLVREFYPIADGVAAYDQHRRLHQQLGVPTSGGRWPMLADWR
jgi:hypothetical protein